jgi:2-polyprenyl-3-methyl-5-hydroxy-6-metoxy-1,4-benzoquinol methylase
MPTSKTELEKIFLDYHNQDVMADKYIEDEAQYYTYDWVFKHLAGCKSVLELGYGEGLFTKALVERGFSPTVVDGSHSLLEKAKSLYGDKIKCQHELFEEYKPKDKFDCVMATHVLEHVDDPVLLLRQMRSWLNASGRLIIIVPNKESIHRQLAVIMKLQPQLDSLSPRDVLVGHQRVYSLETLAKDVKDAGYSVLEEEGFFLKTLPNSMMLGYSIELIRALNLISPKIPRNLLANIGMVVRVSTES